MSSALAADAVRSTLKHLMETSPTVTLLGETVGRGGGLWGSSAGLLAAFGPDRVCDVPVSEHAMVGLAVGMALGGKTPVLELASTHRLAAVVEPLVEAAHLSQTPGFALSMVVRVPYGTEAGPRIDVPIGDLCLAGVRVVCARSAHAASVLLTQAVEQSGPTVLLEPRRLHDTVSDGISDLTSCDTLYCHTLRRGSHLTLVAWGGQVSEALDVAEQLGSEGLDVEVIDPVSLSPLDADGLSASVRRTGRLVVLHPGDLRLADRVVQTVVDGAFLYLEAPPARATTPNQALAAAREAATW